MAETTEIAITVDDIVRALARLDGYVHHTPVLTSRTLDRRAGAAIFFKCENMQKVGAFKFRGAMNAVLVKGDAVGATLHYGAGAGAEPTASAVIADLVDVTRMHTADPGHRVPHLAFQPDQLTDVPILPIGDVVTSYYLRMRVDDKPGVLADITRILADREISIDAMIQKEPSEGEDQTDIILLTHRTVERNIDDAIARIEALPTVRGKIVRIRLEELN